MLFDVENFKGVGAANNRNMTSSIKGAGSDLINTISLYPGMGLIITIDNNFVRGYLPSAFFYIGCLSHSDAKRLAEQMHLYSTRDKDAQPEYFV